MQIIMRMLTVTYCIFALGYVYRTVGHHLDVLSVENSVLLLGHHVGNPCFLRLKIVPHLLHGV